MKTAVLLFLFAMVAAAGAQPLDDVHLSGVVWGCSDTDTTAVHTATVIIENLSSGVRDSVITDMAGHWAWTGTSGISGEHISSVPSDLALAPSYPNPFTETTTIRILNNRQQRVRLDVYNILGQRVAGLVDDHLRPGAFELTWNGVNRNGTPLAQGMYFLCLNGGGHVVTRKMVVLGSGSGPANLSLRASHQGSGSVFESLRGAGSRGRAGMLDDFSLRLEFRHADYDSVIANFTLPDGRDSVLVTYLRLHDTPPAGMVLVPAATYNMGAAYLTEAQPIHAVHVAGFYMDTYEVTNAQYRVFCDATARTYPPQFSGDFLPNYFLDYPNYPVVMVSWDDARAYAEWAGKRLPTEAEWELAAKGSLDNRRWPWGDTWVAANANIYDNPDDGYEFTAPVGSYPNGVSPAGCYDMVGNVWEWCEDDWHSNFTGAPSDGGAWVDNPRSTDRAIKSGSWWRDNTFNRCAYRFQLVAGSQGAGTGFRCARNTGANLPPFAPSSPSPANGATLQLINVGLRWVCTDRDQDSLTYDVYFGTASAPPLMSSSQTLPSFDPGMLNDSTVYYWRIVAHDDHNHSTAGPTWHFTTEYGNVAPDMPSQPFPVDEAIAQSVNVTLTWTCVDPDMDDLTFDVYFGTASTPPFVSSGQTATSYNPGLLDDSTTYHWQIVAHDSHAHSRLGPIWSFTTENGEAPAGMILIPAGPFSMGATYQGTEALPIHTVNVPTFYMDIYEVTNQKYKAFCDATGRAYPPDPGFSGMTNYFTNPTFANYPVVLVTWNDAHAYAAWAGKRLPSEAEWERAAKGNLDNRQWPWGDTWITTNANTSDTITDGHVFTAAVGSYPNGVSLAGCYDMAGNVSEWCEDTWHFNYTNAPTDGSAWVEDSFFRVYRGGDWIYGNSEARCAYRRNYNSSTIRGRNMGFRCARTP